MKTQRTGRQRPFEFVPRNLSFNFLDSVDLGGVAFSVESVIPLSPSFFMVSHSL